MNAIEILNECTVDGNNIKLPSIQLNRNTYLEVAKKLQGIGGKWKGGKVSAFTFDYDPSDLLAEIQGGANRNIKKEFQFFETPAELATALVNLADISQHHTILEPSAGKGAIIKAVHRQLPSKMVGCYETCNAFYPILAQMPKVYWFGEDFLTNNHTFDRIIANPPFSRNQDIDHIRKMYAVLKDGGRIVSVASKHWQTSSNRKETEFREWLQEVGAQVIDVEAGTFKESGTNIATVIVVIDKSK